MSIAKFVTLGQATPSQRRAFRKAFSVLALVGAVLLPACASEEPPPPTVINAQVSAVASLNPDSEGRASPLVVRLYELTAGSPFDSADFFDLYDQDKATLGETFVAVDEIRVLPSDTKTITRTLQPTTRFVGIVAAFRDVQLSTWRGLTEVPLNQTTTYDLMLDSLSVSIKPAQQ